MTQKERLLNVYAQLTDEQRADVLRAIVCWITGEKIPPRKLKKDNWEADFIDTVYNRDMVYIITQILLYPNAKI